MRAVLAVSLLAVVAAQIFLDIGSSGTKVYVDNKKSVSVKCKTTAPHLGLACAAYADKHSLKATITADKVNGEDVDVPAFDDGHATEAFVKETYEIANKLGAKDGSPLLALATAGMRIPGVPDITNSAICSQTPEQTGHNYKVDKNFCRTTPGTEEAFNEWIAVQTSKSAVAKGRSVHVTGGVRSIFSMGGASAQVAVPLSRGMVGKFLDFMKLAATHKAEWFSPETNPRRKDYEKNFVNIHWVAPYCAGAGCHTLGTQSACVAKRGCKWNARPQKFDTRLLGTMAFKKPKGRDPRAKIHGWAATVPGPIVAVGTFSFLAFAVRDSVKDTDHDTHKHVAGGTNAMKDVIDQLVINDESLCSDWGKCLQSVRNELAEDPFYHAVTDLFHTNHWDLIPSALISNMNLGRSMDDKDGFCGAKVTGKGGQGADVSTDDIVKLDSAGFADCTTNKVIATLTKHCGKATEMKDKAVGKYGGSCDGNLARIAIAQDFFGSPPAAGVDLVIARGGTGDPADGARWIWRAIKRGFRTGAPKKRRPKKKNAGPKRTRKPTAMACMPLGKADATCATLKTKVACAKRRTCKWAAARRLAPKKKRATKKFVRNAEQTGKNEKRAKARERRSKSDDY